MADKSRILIVDDEPAVCRMLEKFLIKKGYESSSALSGKEAIDKIKEEKPHIVLLDIKMPKPDGIATLKKIKKIDERIGIIMITAVKDDAVGRKCMKLGAYGYVTKPFDLNYLETVLLVKLLDYAK